MTISIQPKGLAALPSSIFAAPEQRQSISHAERGSATFCYSSFLNFFISEIDEGIGIPHLILWAREKKRENYEREEKE